MDTTKIQNLYRNKLTLFIYYGMCALVLLAAGIFLFNHDWGSAVGTLFVFLSMLVPSILKGRFRVYLPFTLELGIVTFIFLTLFLGEVIRFYDSVPLWDKFLHLQSGLLLGAAGYVLVYLLNENTKSKLNLSPGFVSLFAVTFSLAIGVLWEIGEFAFDFLSGSQFPAQASNADTMWDLIADGSGALVVSVVGYFWMHRYKRLPFTPWLLLKEKIKEKLKSTKGARSEKADVVE